MKTPQHVVDTRTWFAAKRAELQAMLDSVELVLVNVDRVWPPEVVAAAKRAYKKRGRKASKPAKQKARKLALQPAKVHVQVSTPRGKLVDAGAAAARRIELRDLICKSAHGLTIGELRSMTPKMDPTARQNSLYILRVNGDIRRDGSTWVRA